MKVFTFRETTEAYEILVFNRVIDSIPKDGVVSDFEAVTELQNRVKLLAEEAAKVMVEEYIKTVPYVFWYGRCPACGNLYVHLDMTEEQPNATFAPCHKGNGLRPVINWSREIPE